MARKSLEDWLNPQRPSSGTAAHVTWMRDIRGAVQLGVDAAIGITDVVEHLHHTIGSVRAPLGQPSRGTTRGITGFVYRSVRAGMRFVGKGIDASLAPFIEALPRIQDHRTRDLLVAILNGIHGDHLARTVNPLAITMSLRHDGRAVDVTSPHDSLTRLTGRAPKQRLVILIHGLCMNDTQWRREGYSHGDRIAAAIDGDVLALRYNTGRHIHQNGADLADRLEALVTNWLGTPPELVLIGHSMGGLVARSACHSASKRNQGWVNQLKHLVFLGSPHHGAPLERGGFHVDQILGLSPYSSPFAALGQSRSAGIKDLRYGRITDGDERVPLPAEVPCYAIAGRLDPVGHDRADQFIGDGLVPLDSALGQHADHERELGFPVARQAVLPGVGHLALLWHEEVGAHIERWLTGDSD